ncbi:hypothetical protein SDC9_158637 [bioreactor metagenome]|uniref:Uncharacterized protein n=1 Tax=bioreactor metagenome TaxID=1076179 RepID=A0A645FCH7_9ZZZZ
MVYNQIIKGSSLQQMLQVIKKLPAYSTIHRIQQHSFFIQNQIGIVGYAPRNGERIFKKGQSSVAPAHPMHIVRDFIRVVHPEVLQDFLPSPFGRAGL